MNPTLRFEEAAVHWKEAKARVPEGDARMHRLIDSKLAEARYGRASVRRDTAYAGGQVRAAAPASSPTAAAAARVHLTCPHRTTIVGAWHGAGEHHRGHLLEPQAAGDAPGARDAAVARHNAGDAGRS